MPTLPSDSEIQALADRAKAAFPTSKAIPIATRLLMATGGDPETEEVFERLGLPPEDVDYLDAGELPGSTAFVIGYVQAKLEVDPDYDLETILAEPKAAA